MPWAVGLAAILGLAVGSFLNVVVWRVPEGRSVVSPASACPACGHVLRRRDNVPVVSWLVLRGRCRDCRAPISPRYPLVELGTAALMVGVVLRFGGSEPWAVPAYAYLAAVGLALALIDLATHRLPDVLVLPSYVVVGALLVVASALGDSWGALVPAVVGGVGLVAAYFVMALAYPGGMGLGDVKLAGVLGLALGWVGWGALVIGAFAAFLLGGVFAVLLMVTGRAGRRSGIPFGPWMLLGAGVGIGWGERLWAGYLAVVGL